MEHSFQAIPCSDTSFLGLSSLGHNALIRTGGANSFHTHQESSSIRYLLTFEKASTMKETARRLKRFGQRQILTAFLKKDNRFARHRKIWMVLVNGTAAAPKPTVLRIGHVLHRHWSDSKNKKRSCSQQNRPKRQVTCLLQNDLNSTQLTNLGADLYCSPDDRCEKPLEPSNKRYSSRASFGERSVAHRGSALRHQRQVGARHLEPQVVDRGDGAAVDRRGILQLSAMSPNLPFSYTFYFYF